MAKEPKDERAERIKQFRFQKGVSPNPGGRPKGTSLTKVLREIGNETNERDKERRTFLESTARMLWHKAANEGSVRATAEILDRLEGKALQQIVTLDAERSDRIDDIIEKLKLLRTNGNPTVQ